MAVISLVTVTEGYSTEIDFLKVHSDIAQVLDEGFVTA